MCFRCYVSQVIIKKKLEGNRSEKTFTKRSNCKAKKYVPRVRFLLVQIVKIIHVRPLLVKLDLIAHLLLTKKMSPVFILLPIAANCVTSHVNYHSKCTFTRGWHSTPNTFWGATSEVWSFQQKPLVTTEQHYVRISCSVSKKKGSIGWWFNWSTIFS